MWRTWMSGPQFYVYWMPPYDDDLKPDTAEEQVKTIARRHNLLLELS